MQVFIINFNEKKIEIIQKRKNQGLEENKQENEIIDRDNYINKGRRRRKGM